MVRMGDLSTFGLASEVLGLMVQDAASRLLTDEDQAANYT
jgi:hypothetical protein